MSLATLFRIRNNAVAALYAALQPVVELVQIARAAPVALTAADRQGATVVLRFSDGSTETIPHHVLEDHPDAIRTWWHAREKAAQRDFANWQLETLRTMLASRRAAIVVAEKELAEAEESFAKRFGSPGAAPTY